MKVYSKNVRSDRQKANVCRMCLARYPDAEKAVDIFIGEPYQNYILPIIEFCIGLECCKEDGLPSHICNGCHQSLNIFFAFKSMCLASEVYLKRINAAAVAEAAAASAAVDKTDEDGSQEIPPVLDTDGGNELLDKLSLAESNDMVILETDDVHPGTPYEVLCNFQESVAPTSSEAAVRLAASSYNEPAHDEQVENYRNEPHAERENDVSGEGIPQETHLFIVKNAESAPSDGEKENMMAELEVRVAQSSKNEPILKTGTVEISKNPPVSNSLQDLPPKPYTCQVCLKQFRNSGSLGRHALIHDGRKPHGCPQCGKRFTQKESLKRHIVSHSDSRFVCHLCDKCLKSKEGLRCHMRTHHSDRSLASYYKYKCKFCDKSFAHSSGLSRHSAIHKGVVFSCDFCPRKFTDKSPWKKHKERHLRDTPVGDKPADRNCRTGSDSQPGDLKEVAPNAGVNRHSNAFV